MKKRELATGDLAETLRVARGEQRADLGEGESKLLGFFLRDGECTAEISESTISVWYSWLVRPLPSRYLLKLAPGLVGELMRLGDVARITDEATFLVGPSTTGTGQYTFSFQAKWVLVRCEETRIIIEVRDKPQDFGKDIRDFLSSPAHCDRCNGVLRTPLAKQCLTCGHDWH